MKFYSRYPGDINIKTGHLDPAEFGCYDRLLDHYYATEAPIPASGAYSICRAVKAEHRRACDNVLAQFFTLTEAGWVQQRAEEVIAAALPRIEAARENGKKGGRPRRTQEKPTGFSEETQDEPRAKTIHKPKSSPTSKTSTPNPQRGRTGAVSLKAWAEAVKARGEKLIPEGDPVFSYAERVGLPSEFLDLAWLAFRRRYIVQHPAKRYTDWRRVFRNCVEGNWLKLWYADQHGAYALTTVGIQAQRAAQEAA